MCVICFVHPSVVFHDDVLLFEKHNQFQIQLCPDLTYLGQEHSAIQHLRHNLRRPQVTREGFILNLLQVGQNTRENDQVCVGLWISNLICDMWVHANHAYGTHPH